MNHNRFTIHREADVTFEAVTAIGDRTGEGFNRIFRGRSRAPPMREDLADVCYRASSASLVAAILCVIAAWRRRRLIVVRVTAGVVAVGAMTAIFTPSGAGT